MRTKRLKIIPDRIFHTLWDSCKSAESEEDYVKKFMSPLSADFINFYRKYDITELVAKDMLENIYHCFHMSFADIISKAKQKPSQISHIFCIPIRTVEDWKAGKNPCPAYIRLMLLRHFYLINLGKYIALESDLHRNTIKPAKYHVKNSSPATTDIKKITISKSDYNRIQSKLANSDSESLSPAEEIIRRTDYLRARMKQ